MKVAITGVAGFIGSNLAKKLLEKGYSVTGIDNLSQGDIKNIANFKSNNKFSFIEHDILNLELLQNSIKDCDAVIHLAAYKIPRYGNALKTLLVNSQGTHNVLETAKEYNIKAICASTSDVYGKNPDVPFNEDSSCVFGSSKIKRWAYAVSKLFDEHLGMAYFEEYDVNVNMLRFFGGYGPNQNLTWWGGPQSVFIGLCLDDKPLPIHGNGLQTRTFTHISDLVQGIIRVLENDNVKGEIFNIGSDQNEIAIIDLAKLIWSLIRDSEPKIEMIPYTSFSGKYEDVMRRVPDISKAKKLLGFEPKIDLKSGLQKTIEWQKQRLKEIQ